MMQPPRWVTVLLLLAVSVPARVVAAHVCPPLSCAATRLGYLWDHNNQGHLGEEELQGDLRKSQHCMLLCRRTRGCFIWMFRFSSDGAFCRMWSLEQSPCNVDPSDGANPVHYNPTPPWEGFFGFGGNCSSDGEAQGQGQGMGQGQGQVQGQGQIPLGAVPAEDLTVPKEYFLPARGVPTEPCPWLKCNVATRGFLFDHPARGHLTVISTATSRRRRAHDCWSACRKTEGCAFWMFEQGNSPTGYCKMWNNEQNPCDPDMPGDPTSAHFQHREDRRFVVGGHCKGGASNFQFQNRQRQL
ncbi:unnamed protein product [Closterium sp. Yama58-4]|nr:unnamed protein product [Closterium sp. Yama58-4]